MKNRTLDFTQPKDLTLRDLLNNLGLNSYASVPVTKIMKTHLPQTEQQLARLINQSGNLTLSQRSNLLWLECNKHLSDPLFKAYNINKDDCNKVIYKVLVSDSWLGFSVELKAMNFFENSFNKLYLPFVINQNYILDSQYSIDFEIATDITKCYTNPDQQVVIGIQVKPEAYRNTENESWLTHKTEDKRKQGIYKSNYNTHVIDLYYKKDNQGFYFTNMDDVVKSLCIQTNKRFSEDVMNYRLQCQYDDILKTYGEDDE